LQQECGTSLGLLTLTFPTEIGTREAQKKLGNFKRRVLKRHFGFSITVREFTMRGRPHFHLAIDCKVNISSGYAWAHHKAVQAWNKTGRKGAKPRGSLNRNARLKELHGILNEKGPLYGFGRIELTPIEKPDAIGFYVGGYLSKSLANKPADAKGTRAVNYSHGCPRVFRGTWSWANESAWLWRAKLRTWAAKHGCLSLHEVAAFFGPKWAYHHREEILATELSFYPTAEHAQRDGVKVPPEAIDIHITRDKTGVLRDSGQTKCGVVPPEPSRAGPSEIQHGTPVGDKFAVKGRSYTIGNKTGTFALPRRKS
jgi:hypothetical protein